MILLISINLILLSSETCVMDDNWDYLGFLKDKFAVPGDLIHVRSADYVPQGLYLLVETTPLYTSLYPIRAHDEEKLRLAHIPTAIFPPPSDYVKLFKVDNRLEETAKELCAQFRFLEDALELELAVSYLPNNNSSPLWITYEARNPLFRHVRYSIDDCAKIYPERKGVVVEIKNFDLARTGVISEEEITRDKEGDIQSYSARCGEIDLTEQGAQSIFETLAPFGIRVNSRFLVGNSPLVGGTMRFPSVSQCLQGYIATGEILFEGEIAETRVFLSVQEAHEAVLNIERRIRGEK